MKGRSPFDIPLPPLPDTVLQALAEREEKKQNHDAYRRGTNAFEIVNEDVRTNYIPGISRATQLFLTGKFAFAERWNTRLFNAACDLAGNRVDERVATELLLAGAKPVNEAEKEKALSTIRSAYSQVRVPARAYCGEHRSKCRKQSGQSIGKCTIIRVDP